MTIVSEHVPKNSRNTEAVLLVMAIGIAMGCYAMVGIGFSPQNKIPGGVIWYGAGFVAMFGGLHVVLRKFAPYADPVILPIAAALNGIGLAMINRLDLAKETSNAPKQLMWTGLGVILCAAVVVVVQRHQKLRSYTYISMVLAIVLLILPIIPGLGKETNGAQIWVAVGGFRFQPGELTKIVLTIFFAGYLVSNREQLALAGPKVLGIRLPRGRDLGPLLIVWIISVGVLVLQRDLGTSLLFFGVFVAMLYIATQRVSWVIVALSLFMSAAFFAWTQFGHVQVRVEGWLNTFDQEVWASGTSQQLAAGLFGMANGGLIGTGLGEGRPDLTPIAESDYIYAALGEELGLVGLFAILLMYLVLIQRTFRTALGVRDGFGKLVAAGLGFVMCLQLFVVIGGVTRVIPLTGLTTPLIAYGGSSLLSNWIIIGLILRISDSARQPTPPVSPARVVPENERTGATQALAAVAPASSSQPAAASDKDVSKAQEDTA